MVIRIVRKQRSKFKTSSLHASIRAPLLIARPTQASRISIRRRCQHILTGGRKDQVSKSRDLHLQNVSTSTFTNVGKIDYTDKPTSMTRRGLIVTCSASVAPKNRISAHLVLLIISCDSLPMSSLCIKSPLLYAANMTFPTVQSKQSAHAGGVQT